MPPVDGPGGGLGSEAAQDGAQMNEGIYTIGMLRDDQKIPGTANLNDGEDAENEMIAGDEPDDLVREEAKEEEYDYFLDAHRDENRLDNQGYHLIDPADLEASTNSGAPGEGGIGGSNSQGADKLIDEDDLDEMQDEGLRQYAYQHMLEGLRE